MFTHLHTPELNSGLHWLGIPGGGRTVIPDKAIIICHTVGIPKSLPVQHDNAVPVPIT